MHTSHALPARSLAIDVIHGLPAHVLLIHVVVVLIPLGAFFTIISAVWPTARRKLGFITPLTCLIALIFVPISTSAGNWYREYLEKQTGQANPLIEHHRDLGEKMIWFAIGLFVVSLAVYLLGRASDRPADAEGASSGGGLAVLTRLEARTSVPVWLSWGVAVVSIVMAVLAVWWTYRVGDAGAQAEYAGIIH